MINWQQQVNLEVLCYPLSGPRTGPLSAEQSMPLTGPLPVGCELEIFNQWAA